MSSPAKTTDTHVTVKARGGCSPKIIACIVAAVVVLAGGTFAAVYFLVLNKKASASASFDLNFPVLKPSVEATVPDALKASSSTGSRRRNDERPSLVKELQDRVFLSQGPSNIYSLLDIVDERVTSLNARSSSQSCLTATPVQVDVTGWPNETLTPWIQCYEELSTESFLMFGNVNGTYYIHETGPVVRYTAFIHETAADESEGTDQEYPCCMQVNGGGSQCQCVQATMTCWRTGSGGTPISEEGGNCRTTDANWPTINATNQPRNIPNSTMAKVNLYLSVGGNYAPSESGSIANIHVEASPGRATVEATYGGIGMGFCGVQMVSYDNKIRVIGSHDWGGECRDVEEACTSGNGETELATSECEGMGFKLLPLGRQSSWSHPNAGQSSEWPVSKYPSNMGPSVNIDYQIPANTIKYGPDAVPAALAALGDGAKF